VHVNRANTRGAVVNIEDERSDFVYDILSGGRTMRFRPLGKDRQQQGEILLSGINDEGTGGSNDSRYIDNQLDTLLGPDALAKKLLKIARDARTAEEEQGVNILYLAFGFVTWFEDEKSDVRREAPLVLLPVELVRNERTSTYDLRMRPDDLMTNLPLQQRWQDDFGMVLPELEVDDDWRPSDYFDQVDVIVGKWARWSIDRNGMQLGFFSFSKLLMYRDLNLDAWPDGNLENHDLVRGLLYEGFGEDQAVFGNGESLDAVLPPENICHVVDADASQAKVIEEARCGKNLVVQGPPGTGKSQTIANIIAAAAKEGKSVLFVAEKMAALEVVHDRLVKVGLADICLELHSRTANKRQVLEELKRTLNAGNAIPAMPDQPHALHKTRDELNAIAEALHAPVGETGDTAFGVLSRQARYIGLGASPPTFTKPNLSLTDRAAENRAITALARYGAAIEAAGDPSNHPLRGVRNTSLQPVDQTRLKPLIKAARDDIANLDAVMNAALDLLGLAKCGSFDLADMMVELLQTLGRLEQPQAALARNMLRCDDRSRLRSTLALGKQWHHEREAGRDLFLDHAFSTNVTHLRGPLAAGTLSFFTRWGGAYRTASRDLAGLLKTALPGSADGRLECVDRVLEIARLRGEWAMDEPFCQAAVGEDWRGERTDWSIIESICEWADRVGEANTDIEADIDDLVAAALAIDRVGLIERMQIFGAQAWKSLDELRAFLDLGDDRFPDGWREADLPLIIDALNEMAEAVDRYPAWAEMVAARKIMDSEGIGQLADRLASRELNVETATVELRFARAEAIWRRALEANPALADLAKVDRHALVAQFATLENQHLHDNVTGIVAAHLSQLPRGALGEMKIVRGEMGKKRGHKALRRLFSEAPNAIQRIKPVLLMSPISVAQYLTPGTHSFDLLLIDEASQVRPEDALGAIARARQVVVVGDQKQLPPTSFFDRLTSGDGEDENVDDAEESEEDLLGGAAQVAELESILTLCEARGLPARMLEWHYRSRDPSLIRVSNREFYSDRLILPPSPLERDPTFGLTFTKVEGAYDKGGRRDNRLEGEALARAVAKHARNMPDQTLGIVTFSVAQKNTINELLEHERRKDKTLDDFLREGGAEDVFIKNIENVQGDERDVIFISVGYGPTQPGGRMIGASFGPVNLDGGERRLNVLFTRARLRCEVFASFDPGDLDVSRSAREGPRVLKRFLEFAKTRQIVEHFPTGDDAESPFEEDVADTIRSFGFLADPQVGSVGFRIDIGVRHPDQPGSYILAVECDGATYHSALWARERDRLRQGVLENLGWRFHRIWSTDWFYNRNREIARLRDALEYAREAERRGKLPVREPKVPAAPSSPPIAEPQPVPEVIERQMPAYSRAYFPVRSQFEPHEAPMPELQILAQKIVEHEGPINAEEVARRISACFGRERAGNRILNVTKRALGALVNRSLIAFDDGFYLTEEHLNAPAVRDRSSETGATLKASSISLLEIRAAIKIAQDDNAGAADEDLVRAAARLLGFKRVGSDLRARIFEALTTDEA
jgi:phage tail protein X